MLYNKVRNKSSVRTPPNIKQTQLGMTMSRAFDIESVIREATINEKISLLVGTAPTL